MYGGKVKCSAMSSVLVCLSSASSILNHCHILFTNLLLEHIHFPISLTNINFYFTERDAKTLFVKNLPFSATADDLREVFEDAVDIRLPQGQNGSNRGYEHANTSCWHLIVHKPCTVTSRGQEESVDQQRFLTAPTYPASNLSLVTVLPTLSSKLRLKQRRWWRRPREVTSRGGPLWLTLLERRARKGPRCQVNTSELLDVSATGIRFKLS